MGRNLAFEGESMEEHKIRMTDRGWKGIQAIAREMGFRGVAPLLEAIVRGKCTIIKKEG